MALTISYCIGYLRKGDILLEMLGDKVQRLEYGIGAGTFGFAYDLGRGEIFIYYRIEEGSYSS